ncbi:amidohydrolase family protein [Actinomadura opuntiae]|uniref:amidohydrolase family protein n=1 Tax=Actinomadura sp. OS1-43 TaxID=604315 RepID=UPI00255A7A16|nr:amidohydrolase family protein [Actinomadura sp. OS1-43]MDL4816499.1 amidohydrolase family protein [Actinomadura sp. OS1-43]
MTTDLEFVDAHVHYWQPSVNDWYPALRSRPVYRDILPGDFPAGGGHVHVSAVSSPRWVVEESRWLEQLRRETGFPSAVIGTIDPAAPFTEIERDIRAQAENDAFRGIRVFSGLDPTTEMAVQLLRMLADQDWVFDLIAHPVDMASYLPLIEKSPDTAIVLEHAGWPDGPDPEQFRAWRQSLAPLAAFDNVDCKISGLGMALGTTAADRLRPYVEACLELFGVDRCFFGSNFPVDSVAGTYGDLIDAYRQITAPLGTRTQGELFAANARRRYRLPD